MEPSRTESLKAVAPPEFADELHLITVSNLIQFNSETRFETGLPEITWTGLNTHPGKLSSKHVLTWSRLINYT